jgi:type I restriction enzyme S subunit
MKEAALKAKPYPKYKPSGVEWLGDVPEQWEVKRLKYSASINDDSLPETTLPDFEFKYVDIGGVNAVDGITAAEEIVFENAPSRARRKVRHGDTIVSTVRTYLRAIAPIKNPPENLIVSTGFAVVRPRKVEPAFLAYALRESSFIESVVARSTGVSYPACNASEVGGIAIPLPTPAEQRAIAAFLDRETGRVDRLVAKERELLERLKEKHSALISQTVTRGLPPEAAAKAGLPVNPRLKPSGIEWLGNVPEHWKVKALKFIANVKTGFAFSSDDFVDEGVPVLRIGDIDRNGQIDLANAKYLPRDFLRTNRDVIVREGDIAMAMTGATIGKSGRYRYGTPALLNQRVCLFRSMQTSSIEFLWYLLNTEFYMEHVLLTAFGGAQPNISDTQLLACSVPVPPPEEQDGIAAFLRAETAKMDALIRKADSMIECLLEYRTSLITAAIMGKIDVRGHAA